MENINYKFSFNLNFGIPAEASKLFALNNVKPLGLNYKI